MENLKLSIKSTPRTPITPRTPKTPRKHHNKYELDNIPSQKFKIGYQKVTIDVDLEQNTISGETDITVLPLDSSLKNIKLDCRGMQIKSIIINQRRAHYSYDDFLQNQEYMNDPENPILADYNYDNHFDSNSTNISYHQHEMIRAKFYPLFSDQNNTDDPFSSFSVCTSELNIKIPEGIKLRLQDTSKITFSPIGTNRSMNETPNTANTLLNSEKVYTPLNIKIIYTVKNLKNGILFNGGIHTNVPKNLWYCHTFNNDFFCSTSSWVPCIDNFHEKPAWDINIVVPKTIGDIGQSILIGTKRAEKVLRETALQQMGLDDNLKNKNVKRNDSTKDNNNIVIDTIEDDNDETINIDSIPINVVVPDLVSSRESPHPIDVAKKVVNYQFFNPVCAHHLGFAVGCFEKTPIVDVKPGTDDLLFNQQSTTANSDESQVQFALDNANTNKVPTMLYFMPGRKNEVINSTIFLYKALDYYSREFSSFPFTSYTLLFVDDLPCEICTFAGMTIVNSKLLYGPNIIEPMFDTTEKLSIALAEQYSGVNVLPKTMNDIWCVSGIARYMCSQFLKKLFGFNYYNFIFEKRCELLCEIDVGKRPLSNQMFRFPINYEQDLNFINLKAPLVLMILNRRITKTDKLFGLSRVIPKIFLQAMSNDLINGNNLSTAHFQRVCEKVAHHKLENFFQNWIHNSGIPTLRITQRFNKKRLFIEMSIRQMQTSNLNKNDSNESFEENPLVSNEKITNFVDDANTFMTEDHHFDAQHVFSGPVTVRIHEADGSPYEHILAISDILTKLDIQYNTKYRRRKKEKREGTEEVEDKEKVNEKEKNSKKKDRNDENKILVLGDVLTSSEEIENWDLRENTNINSDNETEKGPSVDEEKDEAFEWLRFDADNEWICKYTINLTDDKFESQLKQDRDVKAQLESVKHFGNVIRPTLYHGKILLRTLVDDRYYYGVRVEAAKALAQISNEENDHIGMRFLLKTFKYFFCYDNKIRKGYDEFDPKEYLPKPNDFSGFSNLFIMKAIIESLSEVRNKDGDTPIELKRILLNILKYNDNSINKFDDSYYYASIVKSICNVIAISKREIPNLNIDYATKSSEVPEPRDTKDQFIYSAIKELNRCLKMDEWSPSYKQIITKTVLEQKIRFVRAGLARMSFIDLLKYTTTKFNNEIRLTAFEGLLIIGGLRNSNILTYFFTSMKLDESSYLRYQLNLVLMKTIGIAAYSGIPSLLDDHEFLKSVSVDSSEKQTFGNSMIHIEDSSSTKLSMQSRKDEIARQSVKGAIDLLRRDLAIGQGITQELWSTLHSCLVPINTRRNVLDIMMVLFEAKDSFIVTTNLPSDKKIIVKVKDKNTDSNIPEKLSFVVSLKRETKFKIQLPTLKFKMNNDTSTNKHKRSGSDPSLAKMPPSKQRKKKFQSENVEVIKTSTTFEVKIKTLQTHTITRYGNNKIIKSNPFSPLRYFRFDLNKKKLTASTNENFEPLSKCTSYIVSLKMKAQKPEENHIEDERQREENTKFLIKLENTTDPATSQLSYSKSETEIKKSDINDKNECSPNINIVIKENKVSEENTSDKQKDNNEEIKNTHEDAMISITDHIITKEDAKGKESNKNLDWGRNTSSIIGKLSPVRRDPNSAPSPVEFSLSRSRSRTTSPEIDEREKKKKGPKIKLKLK